MLKLYLTCNESIDGLIGTDTDVVAGMDMRASLSYDDVAGDNTLTVCLLDAETLGFGISAVLGRTDTLFMGEKLQT